jgi:trehalose 6-phosphate synthase/phosphatase
LTDGPFSVLVLWPLFHYLLWQDVATEYASADAHWAAYAAVNETFAKRVQEVYKPGMWHSNIGIISTHFLIIPHR